jgi:histone H3/H4
MNNKKNLEHINVQQVGKQELKNILKINAHEIVLKSVKTSKKKNKKFITKEDVEEALKE